MRSIRAHNRATMRARIPVDRRRGVSTSARGLMLVADSGKFLNASALRRVDPELGEDDRARLGGRPGSRTFW